MNRGVRIENLAVTNNTNGVSVKGAKAQQGNGDFLATLLMMATQGEQNNSQQGKELLNGEQHLQPEQKEQQAIILDANATLLQLLGINNDTNNPVPMGTVPLTEEQVNQLLKALETLAIAHKGQNSYRFE